MRKILFILLIFSFCLSVVFSAKIVVAHRGASGYLPEHTLEAKVMAYAMGADYLEQDVVMTKDGKLIVLHDICLDRVTDVAFKFPERKRIDGKYYAIDFTLEEIKTLDVYSAFSVSGGEMIPVYPERFPIGKSSFKIQTFEEEIELVQGLNFSTGGNVGIFPEIKNPEFHLSEGKDLSLEVLKILKAYGYRNKDDMVFVQCFSDSELKRIKEEIFPELDIDLKLVQLISKSNPFWMFLPEGMAKVALYADCIGTEMSLLTGSGTRPGKINPSSLLQNAKKSGLMIVPYTFRSEKQYIPFFAANFDELLNIYFNVLDVDGVFTDFPDKVVYFLNNEIILVQ